MLEEFGIQMDARTMAGGLLIVGAYFIGRQIPRWMAGVPFLKPEEAKQGLDSEPDALVVDVRNNRQFASGHIAGALNLPLGELMVRIKDIKQDLVEYADTPVLIVCKNDQYSSRAARILRKNGMNKIAVLEGGLKAWTRAGLPIG